MVITRKAEVYEVRSRRSLGTMWLEDGEIRYSEGNDWVLASIHVRLAETPEEGFEALLSWSNGYVALREVPVDTAPEGTGVFSRSYKPPPIPGGVRPGITRKAEFYDVETERGSGIMWLEDGEIKTDRWNEWVLTCWRVRCAKTPEEGFEAVLNWSNGYTVVREVPVE